jgi:hypothetical protein
MAVALYPGAFKPPHRGHFEVVKRLLKGTHDGKPYTLDNYKDVGSSALNEVKAEAITKVIVFIGGKDRNGISPEDSKRIWEIYKKYLKNIEIYSEAPNPMQNASAYAKKRPEQDFYAITGIRSEEDIVDLRRLSSFKNRENVEGLMMSGVDTARASDLRKYLLSGNDSKALDFIPNISKEDKKEVLSIMKDAIVSESIENTVTNMFTENSGGMPAKSTSAIKSKDRQSLKYLYDYLKNLVPDNYAVEFKHDFIKVYSVDKSKAYNLTPYMASLIEYMIDEGMKITPLPEIKIKKDLVESQDFFGRTAYYDPNVKEIVLYTEGRHPKDILRSFSHEMVHHMQNLEKRMGVIRTSNTNESEDLLELEKEAYLTGNITFRNWEDKIKNGYEKS